MCEQQQRTEVADDGIDIVVHGLAVEQGEVQRQLRAGAPPRQRLCVASQEERRRCEPDQGRSLPQEPIACTGHPVGDARKAGPPEGRRG